jgi:hypothetical protein
MISRNFPTFILLLTEDDMEKAAAHTEPESEKILFMESLQPIVIAL